MHDLLHRRSETFGHADFAGNLARETELRLMARSEAVIAIQADEARIVAAELPNHRVLTVPIAAAVAPAPQPGDSDELLFVGSNTSPNAEGLRWFLTEVWPGLCAARPRLKLQVAGGVNRSLPPAPPGVRYLGFVERLKPLYARAGVVISPLLAGSGLKIKLVEAMAEGKACVVSPVTLQGIEGWAGDAAVSAATPEGFATAIRRLLACEGEREALGRRALEAARERLGPDAAHAELACWLNEAAPATAPSEASFAPYPTAVLATLKA